MHAVLLADNVAEQLAALRVDDVDAAAAAAAPAWVSVLSLAGKVLVRRAVDGTK
jgi:hypothetical protein